MIALDPTTLSPPAQKLVSPSAPEKLQEVAARGVAPGVRPGEMLAVLLLLSASERPTVRDVATRTLAALPEQLLQGALGTDLAPQVADSLARTYGDRLDVLEKLMGMPRLAIETVEHLAGHGSEAVTELIATNEERLLANPRIIELLYLNRRTRMSTADRIVELATRHKVELRGLSVWREAQAAIENELIAEASPVPTPDDVLFVETDHLAHKLADEATHDTHREDDEGKEHLRDKFLPLYAQIANMTVSQKIRRATLGTREERLLLVRDSNRIVATAAVRSPLIQEAEAAMMSRNRNLSEEVLRIIGTTPELMKSYTVKKNLVENPKTPVMISQRLVQHLRENDLRALAKSKNVTGPVKDAARRHLDRRQS